MISIPRKTSCIKTYEYRILNREFELPGERLNSHFFRKEAGRGEDAGGLPAVSLGEHDFKSFCSIHTQAETTVRTIYSLDVIREGDMIRIRVTGNGFLYNMVRILAGTLINVGFGVTDPAEIPGHDRGAGSSGGGTDSSGERPDSDKNGISGASGISGTEKLKKWLTQPRFYHIITQCDVVRKCLSQSPGNDIFP